MSISVLQIINGDHLIAKVPCLGDVTAALRSAKPGRYDVVESSMPGELLPSGYSYEQWVVAIRLADGTVTLEPNPAPVKS
jgi:hypothetical protein